MARPSVECCVDLRPAVRLIEDQLRAAGFQFGDQGTTLLSLNLRLLAGVPHSAVTVRSGGAGGTQYVFRQDFAT